MTVQCLNHAEKYGIICNTRNETMNQTELASHYAVSRRTIQRVLIDASLLSYNTQASKQPVRDKKTSHRISNDVEMLTLLREYHMTPATLEGVLSGSSHA